MDGSDIEQTVNSVEGMTAQQLILESNSVIKRGHEAYKEKKRSALDLYEEGLTLLEAAIQKNTFGDKQLKAMRAKANSIMKRIINFEPSDDQKKRLDDLVKSIASAAPVEEVASEEVEEEVAPVEAAAAAPAVQSKGKSLDSVLYRGAIRKLKEADAAYKSYKEDPNSRAKALELYEVGITSLLESLPDASSLPPAAMERVKKTIETAFRRIDKMEELTKEEEESGAHPPPPRASGGGKKKKKSKHSKKKKHSKRRKSKKKSKRRKSNKRSKRR